MGILSFIRSQLIEIVEWIDDSNYTLVWRFPDQDHEIKNGAQLNVRPGQAAVFVNEGKVADVFGPGRHTLSTQNLPILSRLKGWKYGFESPFKAEIYFVSLRQYMDQKWGTSNPVMIRDDEFAVGNRPGRVRIRAFGNYNFRIADPRRFFEELVSTSGTLTTDEIERFSKSRLVSAFSKAATLAKVHVADIHAHLDELSASVRQTIKGEFESIGLELTSFIIENVSLPPEVEKALDAAAAQSARGVDNTMAWESVGAMRDAAKNPGGNAGMNAGMGMGMGVGMGQMMGQMLGQANPYGGYPQGYPPQGAPQGGYPRQGAPAPAAAASGGGDSLRDKLSRLKAAYEEQLISEEEYRKKKAELLADF